MDKTMSVEEARASEGLHPAVKSVEHMDIEVDPRDSRIGELTAIARRYMRAFHTVAHEGPIEECIYCAESLEYLDGEER